MFRSETARFITPRRIIPYTRENRGPVNGIPETPLIRRTPVGRLAILVTGRKISAHEGYIVKQIPIGGETKAFKITPLVRKPLTSFGGTSPEALRRAKRKLRNTRNNKK